MEARDGIEPPNNGFVDLTLTVWVPRPSGETTTLSRRNISVTVRGRLSPAGITMQTDGKPMFLICPGRARPGWDIRLGQMRTSFRSVHPYRMVVDQKRYLTLYPLIMAGGCAVPQAWWSQEMACSLPCTGSKTMGAGTGSPSDASKVTLI